MTPYIPDSSKRNRIYTIAIASGKGGVGKTSVAVNLSLALCMLKQKVILFDGDLGLGNVTFMLGLKGVSSNLGDVIDGEKRLDEIILEGLKGLLVIPAASGVEKLANLDSTESRNLLNQFRQIEEYGDFLIIDLAAGISETVISFLAASESAIIVTTPGKTAILDAYAIVKVLYKRDSSCKPLLFVNQYQEESDRIATVNKLKLVSKEFLNLDLVEIGFMKKDWRVDTSLNSQNPFVVKYPKSNITKAMFDLGEIFINRSHKNHNLDSKINTLFAQKNQIAGKHKEI